MSRPIDERRITGYPKPAESNFIKAYMRLNEMNESQAIKVAIKALKESLPPDVRERIVKESQNSY